MENQNTAGYWLSPQQKHAWSLTDAGIPAMAVVLVSIEGEVKAETVAEALRAIVSRHEILRTVFRRPAGMKVPFQVILDSAKASFETADLCKLEDPQRRLAELFACQSKEAFNLEQGPV